MLDPTDDKFSKEVTSIFWSSLYQLQDEIKKACRINALQLPAVDPIRVFDKCIKPTTQLAKLEFNSWVARTVHLIPK